MQDRSAPARVTEPVAAVTEAAGRPPDAGPAERSCQFCAPFADLKRAGWTCSLCNADPEEPRSGV